MRKIIEITARIAALVPAMLSGLLIFAGCAGQNRKIIFRPEAQPEYIQVFDYSGIIESQGDQTGTAVPEWVNRFLDGGIAEVELMEKYRDKYIFIGENRGENFYALQQWALYFSAEQDLPRLVTLRIEKRLTSSASLYPDDEYGDFFENFVKSAANVEYPTAQLEDSFWIKQRIEEAAEDPEQAGNISVYERYYFLLLLSVNKANMQHRIRSIMENIKTRNRPTRDQAAAISRVKQNFFSGF